MTSHSLINRQGGFTLLELVIVMVIVGILGMIAVPKLQLSSQFEQRIQADNLVGLLRLAQLRAMNDPNALNPIPAGAAQTSHIASRCGVIAITAEGMSLAKGCASIGNGQLLTAEQLKTASSQGLYVGQLDIDVSANVVLPLTLTFGEVGAADEGVNSTLLTESSWLGQPFVKGEALSETLILTVGNRHVKIEPQGYIHAD